MAKGTVWRMAIPETKDAEVVDLKLDNAATAQISELPDKTGFLIRVWPPNGLVSQGGTNMPTATLIVAFDAEGKPDLSKFDFYK